MQKKYRKRVNIKIVPSTKEIFLVSGQPLPSTISTAFGMMLSASLARTFGSRSHRRRDYSREE